MKVPQEFIEKLNLLLARNRDAHKGYIEAVQNINNTDLRRWMLEYADQRMNFSKELESEIRMLGGEPFKDTSILGDLHRVWMELKGNLTDNEPMSMLKECHRGETKAFEDYESFLNEFSAMPASTHKILIAQKSKIKGAVAQIETMMRMLDPVDA